MNYSQEDILKALTIIQNICSTTNCHQCPFTRENVDECYIMTVTPIDWRINRPQEIWRAIIDD